MLKYLIALIVIVAAWLTWWLASLPLWVPITVTSITAVALLGWFIFQRIRGAQASHQLEGALADQAAAQAENARPDLQAELGEIQSEFDKAVGALKSSKLGRGRRDALYVLPWYVIIGPPGAGKTTALRNSGLQFPYLSAQSGRGVRGIGGTRNCDWWLTNEAVLLDTAGRWSTQDEDREEWLGFLGLLKKYRKKKPLNGIIVTLSVSELADSSSEQLVALAKAVRERIDEAMAQLQMVLPVYVLFTKCDLISGFAESFGNMTKDERGVVWGFTVPLDDKANPTEQFETHFDELTQSLEAFSVRRLKEERRIDVRHKVFGFPQQLEELKSCFVEFLTQLFEENVFSDTPLMRGAYFASGTQEGRPFDRIMQRLASAYSLNVALEEEQQTDQKGYFLRDLFRKVIFPDRDLALRSEGERKRQKRLYYATVGSIFVLAGLLLTVPVFSYFSNRGAIKGFAQAGEELVTAIKKDKGAMQGPQAYAPMLEKLSELNLHNEEGPPVRMRAGLYQGDALTPTVGEFFGRVFQENVFRAIFEDDTATMDEFGRNYESLPDTVPSRTEYTDVFGRLERHLLVTSPKEETEPPLQDVTADNLAGGIADSWTAKKNIAPDSEEATITAFDTSRAYVSALAAHDTLGFRRGEAAVNRARDGLSRVSALDLAIDGLVGRFERKAPEITVRSLVGGGAPAVTGDRKVRPAFTKRVWEDHLKGPLLGDGEGLIGDMWVLGKYALRGNNDGQENKEEYRRRLASRYFERYIDEWREFVRAIRIEPPRNTGEAVQVLQDLTRGKPTPLGRMFRRIKYNVDLVPPPEDDGGNKGLDAAMDIAGKAARRKAGKTGRMAGKVAGGYAEDGTAGANQDGLLTDADVYEAFEGLVDFGVPPAPVDGDDDQTDESTDLDLYVEQLLFIRNALATQADNPSGRGLSQDLQAARSRTASLIGQQEVGWRPVFEALLWPPIDGASMSYSRALAANAGRAWCSGVAGPFDQSFRDAYPFKPHAQDVPLPDFAAFYKPNDGAMWTFYSEFLEPRIPRRGSEFTFATQLGGSSRQVYSAGLLRFLNQSWHMSSALFSGGEPKFGFSVRLRPTPRVAKQVLSVGGRSHEYFNQPEQWTRMTWPGESPDEGASIEISGAGGMREVITQDGPWGLFRLLEQGSVKRNRRSNTFSVTWRLRSHGIDVTMEFKPTKRMSPFFAGAGRSKLMSLFRSQGSKAPQDIVAGQNICR